MPTTDTYTAERIEPAIAPELAVMTTAKLLIAATETTYPAGTVLGQITTPANEVQTVTLGASPASGTFTLTFRGATTAAIAYNATAATVQAALVALSTIGTGNVAVTGNAGGPYTCTFGGALAYRDLPLMTATSSVLDAASAAVTVTPAQGTAGRGPDNTFAAYNDSLSDGTQVAKAILMYDTTVGIDGSVTIGGEYATSRTDAPIWIGGYFRTEDLTGLDANGIADLGRLITGDATSGLLRVV